MNTLHTIIIQISAMGARPLALIWMLKPTFRFDCLYSKENKIFMQLYEVIVLGGPFVHNTLAARSYSIYIDINGCFSTWHLRIQMNTNY